VQNLSHALDVLPGERLFIADVGHAYQVRPQACGTQRHYQAGGVHAGTEAEHHEPASERGAQGIGWRSVSTLSIFRSSQGTLRAAVVRSRALRRCAVDPGTAEQAASSASGW
jgi:hypothetical protein